MGAMRFDRVTTGPIDPSEAEKAGGRGGFNGVETGGEEPATHAKPGPGAGVPLGFDVRRHDLRSCRGHGWKEDT